MIIALIPTLTHVKCVSKLLSLPINLILGKEEVKFDLNFHSAFDAR